MTWVNSILIHGWEDIQAQTANTYTLCAAVWRLFMQIQGDLDFLVV